MTSNDTVQARGSEQQDPGKLQVYNRLRPKRQIPSSAMLPPGTNCTIKMITKSMLQSSNLSTL